VQDTYLVGGPPDLKAMSGSIESDRVIQLHFRRKATDEDRKWLLDAINMKLASDAALEPGNGAVEAVPATYRETVRRIGTAREKRLAELRTALESIVTCYERNVGRQDEKLADIPIIARRVLAPAVTSTNRADPDVVREGKAKWPY
jgi:hypothetical protein